MGYSYVDFYYGDGLTYLLLIVGFIVVLFAQIKIRSTYNKYKNIKNSTHVDGLDTAQKILKNNNLDLYIVRVGGELSDHYNPANKSIRLSDDVYSNTTIASVAIAAHECGHAIQDKEGYVFFRLRSLLVPVVNFINYLGYFAIFISLFTGIMGYLTVGIFIICATLVFQLVTLPVEFDASKRGLNEIKKLGILSSDEYRGAEKVLKAAAFTYVAGTISTLLQLLRLVLMFSRRRD